VSGAVCFVPAGVDDFDSWEAALNK
jgi:hypothetical protein